MLKENKKRKYYVICLYNIVLYIKMLKNEKDEKNNLNLKDFDDLIMHCIILYFLKAFPYSFIKIITIKNKVKNINTYIFKKR
jgi:hypothetical protein